jgi:hypothetical protein
VTAGKILIIAGGYAAGAISFAQTTPGFSRSHQSGQARPMRAGSGMSRRVGGSFVATAL